MLNNVNLVKKQEGHRAYGTAISRVIIHQNKIHLDHSQRGQLVKHTFISFA